MEMQRYSKIYGKNEREMVMLKGFPCKWGKCKFCDYICDNETNEKVIVEYNKNILKNIRTIYPNFKIGISTSSRGDYKNNWKDPYRHWCFKCKNSIFDSSLTKNAK